MSKVVPIHAGNVKSYIQPTYIYVKTLLLGTAIYKCNYNWDRSYITYCFIVWTSFPKN